MKKIQALLQWFVTTHEGRIFGIIMLTAIIIRLPLLFFEGYFADLTIYIDWGYIATQHFFTIYRVPPLNQFYIINYPPGTVYLFGIIVLSYSFITTLLHPAQIQTALYLQNTPYAFAKLPIFAADLAIIGLLYREAAARHSERFAQIVAIAYGLSPAVLYIGTAWGQTDVLVALTLLLALFSLLSERFVFSGVYMGVTLMIKPQPLILIPFFLLYLYRWHGWRATRRFCIAAIVPIFILCIPIIVPHFQIINLYNNIRAGTYNNSSHVSISAFNFWWSLNLQGHMISEHVFSFMTYSILCELCFGICSIIILVPLWYCREPVYLCVGMALEMFAFFMFMAAQHERYHFLVLPLLLCGVIYAHGVVARRLLMLYAICTVLVTLNLLVVLAWVGVTLLPLFNLTTIPISLFTQLHIAKISWGLAVLQTVAFVGMLCLYIAGMFYTSPTPVGEVSASYADELAPTLKRPAISRMS